MQRRGTHLVAVPAAVEKLVTEGTECAAGLKTFLTRYAASAHARVHAGTGHLPGDSGVSTFANQEHRTSFSKHSPSRIKTSPPVPVQNPKLSSVTTACVTRDVSGLTRGTRALLYDTHWHDYRQIIPFVVPICIDTGKVSTELLLHNIQ